MQSRFSPMPLRYPRSFLRSSTPPSPVWSLSGHFERVPRSFTQEDPLKTLRGPIVQMPLHSLPLPFALVLFLMIVGRVLNLMVVKHPRRRNKTAHPGALCDPSPETIFKVMVRGMGDPLLSTKKPPISPPKKLDSQGPANSFCAFLAGFWCACTADPHPVLSFPFLPPSPSLGTE